MMWKQIDTTLVVRVLPPCLILGATSAFVACQWEDIRAWLTGAWRWVLLSMRLGPKRMAFHFKAQRRINGCIKCGMLRLPMEEYFTCGQCDDTDMCHSCFVQHGAGHPHHLYREVQVLATDTTEIGRARCTSELISSAFHTFGPRPCLGWRPRSSLDMHDAPPHALPRPLPQRDSFAREYEWMSYSEVDSVAHCLGAGLELLLGRIEDGADDTDFGNSGSHALVGVLGATCVPWMLADYACILKGVPVVLMHRATGVEALTHVIQETRLGVLFASRSVRTTVILPALQALSSSSSFDARELHVIWFDDGSDSTCAQLQGPQWTPAHVIAIAQGACYDTPSPSSWFSSPPSALLPPSREHGFDAIVARGASCNMRWRMRVARAIPDTVVKLLPSSGSTGLPKLVVVCDGALYKVGTSGRRAIGAAVPVVVFAYESMRQSHDVLAQVEASPVAPAMDGVGARGNIWPCALTVVRQLIPQRAYTPSRREVVSASSLVPSTACSTTASPFALPSLRQPQHSGMG